ncbi:TPA: N-acetylmuramic acid 6-phosphate etherase [bacterium]|nr:N-acetylmuramic acid 6-phosphate etherase [bacterium]
MLSLSRKETTNMKAKQNMDLWKNLTTESSNPHSIHLEQMTPIEVMKLIHSEDKYALNRIKKVLPIMTKVAQDFSKVITEGGRVFYIGAGTSGRMGVIDSAELVPTFGLPFSGRGSAKGIIAGGNLALRKSVEGAEDDASAGRKEIIKNKICKEDLVIGISASSLAPFVRAALKEAFKRGARTALITMNKIPKPNYIHNLISIVVGPEVITGSTRMKAGLITKAILHNISTTAMVLSKKIYGNKMIDLKTWCSKLEARGSRLIKDLTGISEKKARAILALSKGRVKTALVMAKLNCSVSEAKKIIKSQNGDLSSILGNS